ncbi:MAG: cupredoxin domain-containing protein [bacterium]|nr:cupredoxin domain-containing protein [bacterium]
MKNSYIIGVVLVLIIGIALVFGMKKEKAEAPLSTDNGAAGTWEEGQAPVDGSDTDVQSDVSLPDVDADVSVSTGAVKEFTVDGKNFAFAPSKITVKKGDKVKITFKNSEGFHDWVIDEFGAATKQAKAPTTEVIEFVANKTGSFEYYCSVGQHRAMGMKGTLVVE